MIDVVKFINGYIKNHENRKFDHAIDYGDEWILYFSSTDSDEPGLIPGVAFGKEKFSLRPIFPFRESKEKRELFKKAKPLSYMDLVEKVSDKK